MNLKAPRKTIWIVDDSPTDALRVSKILSSDYDLEILHDGSNALEKLSEGPLPDLLILDWVMPGVTGVEVCRYVREQGKKFANLPIILLTGQHGQGEIVEAFRSGANDYVSKPFVDEELKARVDAQISNRDLSKRIEKSEKDLNSLLMNAPDAILAVDSAGKITFVNDEASRLLIGIFGQVFGKDLSELIPEITRRHIGLGLSEPVRPAPEVRIGDRIFSPSVRVLPSDDSAYTTISLRDVTERQKIESRRLDFYSIIAHDLRTPITSVLLRLQMIFRGRYGILPSGLLDDLRKTEVSLKSQVAMINDFLELAKLEDMSYKIERKPVNLLDLVNSVVEDFKPLVEKQMLSVSVVAPDFIPEVLGDKQRLFQVISNLIGNAVKFTPQEGKVTVTLNRNESQIELSIQDSGCGIHAKDIEGLFDRFTRVEDNSAFTTGSGLGLMIVKEIVEAHGGMVNVESQLGLGSKFNIWLPRVS